MTHYTAPLRDIQFALDVAGATEIAKLPAFEEAQPDLVAAILEEAGKFASGVLAPLHRTGDTEGCHWSPEGVTTPDGWLAAWQSFRDAGWPALGAPQEFGGQGLPKCVSTPVTEMFHAANMAFMVQPLLAFGAAEALITAAADDIKQRYLRPMIDGTWGGTMNLTEPNAGSDLGALRTRAEPQADGTYKLFGQKIFISYGEHDLTENIIHLVLARLPDAPPGVKGISLFVVPKFLVNADGSLGARNDVHCVSIEHKLGIHGSPTCVMAYGDGGGATGHLVGEANRGLEYMFVMMNEARFNVGIQGISQGEAAYQKALAYAQERIQGRDAATGQNNVPIIRHPDVRRTLLRMRVLNQAARLIAYWVAVRFDEVHAHPDAAVRRRANAFIDLLMPIVKGWSTENACDVASLGVQVHGGMGFIEETGAAQYYRDARILTIYEGTTGIQAMDLIGRKLIRDEGRAFAMLIDEMRADAARLDAAKDPRLAGLVDRLRPSFDAAEASGRRLLALGGANMPGALAVATPFLHQLGTVCGAWHWARAALHAVTQGRSDAAEQLGLAEFYFAHVLPAAAAYGATVCDEAAGKVDAGFEA